MLTRSILPKLASAALFLAAALALGADGVWVGTRFIASLEARQPVAEGRQLVEMRGEQRPAGVHLVEMLEAGPGAGLGSTTVRYC